MKKKGKILSILLDVVVMVGIVCLFTACGKGNRGDNEPGTGNNNVNNGTNTGGDAVYYTISFAFDDEILETKSVKTGELPVYTGAIPTKDSETEYEYVFDGWGTLVPANADKTYQASFKSQLVAPAWDGSVASAFSGGSGSESDPYQIATAAELAYLSRLVTMGNAAYNSASVYYKLVGHINIGERAWAPIGTGYDANGSATEDTVFKANFDGNGKKIVNLKQTALTKSYHDSIGIFGKTSGSIKNVKVVKCTVNISNQKAYAGVLCGYSSGKIEGCTVINSTLSGGGCSGVLSGFATYVTDSFAKNCSVKGYDAKKVGGLVGSVAPLSAAQRAMVSNCGYEGAIANGSGLLGYTVRADINDSYASITSTGGSGFANIGGGVTISRCYAEGEIRAPEYVVANGFCSITLQDSGTGVFENITITDCYSNCKLSSKNGYGAGFAGLIVARQYESSSAAVRFQRCFSYSTLRGDFFKSSGFLNYSADKIPTNLSEMVTLSITSCVAFGDVEALSKAASASGMIFTYPSASSFINKELEYALTNCYRAEHQDVEVASGNATTALNATAQWAEVLNTESFYIETLGCSAGVWDFTDLDVQNGVFPKLK